MRPALYPVILGARNPLDAYGRAAFLFDTARSRYRNGSAEVRRFDDLPGLTFTRALAAYGQTSAGALTLFGSGVPRITDKGLLIEGARTNLATYSSDWTDSSWSNSNVTVTAAAATAPDGTLTATKLSPTTSAGTTMVKNVGAVAATAASYSIYVKKGSGATDANKFIMRNLTTATILVNGTLNYDTGVWTTTTGNAALVSTLANGWYRITLYASSGITSGDSIQIYTGFTGSSETAGEYAYFWGAQLEAAAFASSYIPTTSSSATRAADVCSIAVSGITYPATLFAEFERVVDTGDNEYIFQADDGSSNNRSILRVDSSDTANYVSVAGGSVDGSQSVAGAIGLNSAQKFAARFGVLNDMRGARGGTLGAQDTSVAVPSTPSALRVGSSNTGSSQTFGYIRRAALWSNYAASDSQLQAMTPA